MPYVEGFGTWPFGEEWLWEAVACVYLPLLELLDGAPVTVGLTPVLCDQLEAMRGETGDRYLSFLREIRAPIHAEDAAGLERGEEPDLAAEVRRAAGDYELAEQAFEHRDRDLLGAFGALDRVELWTSSATHALLPLLATDAGLRLQLATGTASHLRRFGRWDGGFWLPECAYAPGLERDLADHGVRAFCVDQTRGRRASTTCDPVATEAGPVAVPIDWPTVELVWNDSDGYPAHDTYRDYHRRTVHDLKPWNNGGAPVRPRAPLSRWRASTRATSWSAPSGRVGRRRAAVLRARHRAARPLVVRGARLAGRRAGGGAAPGPRAGHRRRGARARPSTARPTSPSRPGGGTRTCPRGTRRGSARWPSRRAARSCARWPRPPATRARARRSSGPRASCWRCRRATGRSWPPASWPATTRRVRLQAHGADLDAALGALADSAAVSAPEPHLRNLAPDLDLASLTAP